MKLLVEDQEIDFDVVLKKIRAYQLLQNDSPVDLLTKCLELAEEYL